MTTQHTQAACAPGSPAVDKRGRGVHKACGDGSMKERPAQVLGGL